MALWLVMPSPLAAEQPTKASDVNLWPMLTVDRDESGTDIRFFPPVGQYTHKEGEKVFSMLPFFRRKHKKDGKTGVDVLWPLVHVSREDGATRAWRAAPLHWRSEKEGGRQFFFIPFAWTWWDTAKADSADRGVVAPPVWYSADYGKTPDGSYGVAPLWAAWREGSGRGLWILPVYWWRDRETKGDRDVGVVPFFLHWRRGARSGVGVLPVYCQRKGTRLTFLCVFPFYWQGKGYRVVFPFFWSLKQGKVTAAFPFYGQYTSGDDAWRLFLWPAYTWSQKGAYRKHRVLWPLLSWGRDKADDWEFALWPLLGRTQRSREDEHKGERISRTRRAWWMLFPVLWGGEVQVDRRPANQADKDPEEDPKEESEEDKGPTHEERQYHNIFPLYWSGDSTTWRTSETGEPLEVIEERGHRWLLPLYTFNRDKEGKAFSMLWPLWRAVHSDKQERHSVLWRIVDARYEPNGDKRVSVLWRGYRNVKHGETHKVDMFPFLSYRGTSPEDQRFQFLSGLAEFGRDAGRRYWRLFYLRRHYRKASAAVDATLEAGR